MPKKLRRYHFSAGNSSVGPVGFCAVVLAHSKKEAVQILESVMPEEYETGIPANDDEGRVEYFNFYLNSLAVKTSHIDEVHDVNTCDECGAPCPDGIVGCPDGAEICRACFDEGAH